MKSAYSDEVSGQVGPAEQPLAPLFISKELAGNKATLVYQLPAASFDGKPLQEGAFSFLHVYADTRSFLGRLEELVGLEPQAKIPVTVAQGGQQIAVDIPDLSFGTKYYFKACVE